MTEKFERINGLAASIKAQRYLQLGASKGITFNRVAVPFKVAVDPKFLYDPKLYADDATHFHEAASEVFFTRLAKPYAPFDLICLDGPRSFAQGFREFCSSFSLSNAHTLWLIDNTCPSNPASAETDAQRYKLLYRQMRSAERVWMGDIYKLVCAIHDFFPQLSFATFPDHGQTVVWQAPRRDFSPKWNSLARISALDYVDFLALSDSVFKRTPPQQLLETLGRLAEAALADEQAGKPQAKPAAEPKLIAPSSAPAGAEFTVKGENIPEGTVIFADKKYPIGKFNAEGIVVLSMKTAGSRTLDIQLGPAWLSSSILIE